MFVTKLSSTLSQVHFFVMDFVNNFVAIQNRQDTISSVRGFLFVY